MARYELTDAEWERIAPLMPPQQTGKKGRPPKDHRMMFNAMLWLARSGASGKIFRNGMGLGKRCIHGFVCGGITACCFIFSRY